MYINDCTDAGFNWTFCNHIPQNFYFYRGVICFRWSHISDSFRCILWFLQTFTLHFTNLNVLTDGSVSNVLPHSTFIIQNFISIILLLDENTISLLHFLLWLYSTHKSWPRFQFVYLITSFLYYSIDTNIIYWFWRHIHAMGAYGNTVFYTIKKDHFNSWWNITFVSRYFAYQVCFRHLKLIEYKYIKFKFPAYCWIIVFKFITLHSKK